MADIYRIHRNRIRYGNEQTPVARDLYNEKMINLTHIKITVLGVRQQRLWVSGTIGWKAALLAGAAILLPACGEMARLPSGADYGPQPTLAAPAASWLPTVNIAKAVGWPQGGTPTAAPGLQVAAFASGLNHPRWLLVLPNGDVLVAEVNAPAKPDDAPGIKGWFMGLFMKAAGAGVPSANRITLLRDTTQTGVATERHVFLEQLNSPFGMALVGNALFVANTDAIWRFEYVPGATTLMATPGTKIIDLPAGTINHHWTKGLIASADGSKLYVAVGSNSNVGERGAQAEEGRAAIWEVDIATRAHRVFASGLRNPVGMAWEPRSRALWTVVNERDELGSDLVPDYMTAVQDNAFYGWPYSYYGQNVDTRVQPPRPDLVASARAPDYALGAHTAPLGLASAATARLPKPYQGGMFIGQHGSWNRKPHSGYKVIFVPFENAIPQGLPIDVLSGFLNADGQAMGRPVGVAIDNQGALLVADDVGNTIWRVRDANPITNPKQERP